MNRSNFQHGGLTLSYLDAGGEGNPLIALHAHWMEGKTYAPFANAMTPEWRVIAPDQRGHGYSDHASNYTREDYLDDIAALYDHLGLEKAVLLGNSLGGINAYQFAARYPKRVQALIIEDIGAMVADDVSFTLAWKGTFKTREELENRIGARLLPYVLDSFRHDANGWHLAFNPDDMVKSQAQLNGDHWHDWLASICPALLLRGRDSKLSKPELFEQMASKRPNTELKTLAGGHALHMDNLSGFTDAVRTFLREKVSQQAHSGQ
jgi:pimeloyl-ACP methyl ester carboxylesterase